MIDHDSDPVRWRDLPDEPDGDDAADDRARRARALVQRIGDPVLPGPAAMAALSPRGVGRRRAARPPLGRSRRLQLALAAALLLLGAALGASANSWLSARRLALRASETATAAAERYVTSARARLPPPPPAASQPPVTPTPPPTTEPTPASPESPRTAPPPAVVPAPFLARRQAAAVVAPSTRRATADVDPALTHVEAVTEAHALGDAVRRLRRDDDPRGTLAALDEHDARFPGGALAGEASLLRVEAELALGERAVALRLLDGLVLDGTARARELFVLRGELRAEAGRCAEAMADLARGAAARPGAADAIDERALFARASCASRLRRYADARRALEEYATRFPNGPHAAEAARILLALP
jgi:hypothetical protein